MKIQHFDKIERKDKSHSLIKFKKKLYKTLIDCY